SPRPTRSRGSSFQSNAYFRARSRVIRFIAQPHVDHRIRLLSLQARILLPVSESTRASRSAWPAEALFSTSTINQGNVRYQPPGEEETDAHRRLRRYVRPGTSRAPDYRGTE